MRKLLSVGVVVAAVLAVVTPIVTNVGAQAAAPTTVVLSFDEGWASQSVVPAMLDAHGMKGTFYVNSGTIDQPGWLTWNQLLQFQADGQEIGGASLTQQDLTALAAGDAQTSICEDRGRLMNHGLTNVTDFAYPFGLGYETPAVHDAVAACGYNSARRQWGLWNQGCVPGDGCGPNQETIPPADPDAIMTAPQPQSTTSAATMEASVTQAATNGGGLVPFVFHQICSGCDPYSTSQATLQSFLTWLQTKAPVGTVVKTMQQVIGGAVSPSPGVADTTAPTSSIACDDTTCATSYNEGNSISVSLAGVDEVGGSGLDAVRFTTDSLAPTIASPVYESPFPITWTTTIEFAAWDNAGNIEPTNSITITIPDTTPPTSSILCGGVSCEGGWFNAGTQVSLGGIDNGSGIKAIHYTTDGQTPTLSSPTYAGPFTVGATSTVKYFAVDNANNVEPIVNAQTIQIDPAAPVAGMTCSGKECSTGWYRGAVHVAMSATDAGGSGLSAIHYTLDNSTPTAASPVYTGPFTLKVSKWVKFVAIDNAGNASAVKTKLVQIDTARPVVSIKPGDGKHVTGKIKVAVKASDAKSGVAKLTLSIDGHKVTSVKGSSLSINWNTAKVSKTKHTLTATAVDKAGNSTTKTVHLVVH